MKKKIVSAAMMMVVVAMVVVGGADAAASRYLYNGVWIEVLRDNNKEFGCFAAKLMEYHPNGPWEKVLVLYKKDEYAKPTDRPSDDHEVWRYLIGLTAPNRRSERQWEPYGYRLYCPPVAVKQQVASPPQQAVPAATNKQEVNRKLAKMSQNLKISNKKLAEAEKERDGLKAELAIAKKSHVNYNNWLTWLVLVIAAAAVTAAAITTIFRKN